MRAAMSRHGKEFEFLIESGEGHGFRKEENAIAFYGRVDEFLKRHVLAKVDVKIEEELLRRRKASMLKPGEVRRLTKRMLVEELIEKGLKS
jgi:hypothetical protein